MGGKFKNKTKHKKKEEQQEYCKDRKNTYDKGARDRSHILVDTGLYLILFLGRATVSFLFVCF